MFRTEISIEGDLYIQLLQWNIVATQDKFIPANGSNQKSTVLGVFFGLENLVEKSDR